MTFPIGLLLVHAFNIYFVIVFFFFFPFRVGFQKRITQVLKSCAVKPSAFLCQRGVESTEWDIYGKLLPTRCRLSVPQSLSPWRKMYQKSPLFFFFLTENCQNKCAFPQIPCFCATVCLGVLWRDFQESVFGEEGWLYPFLAWHAVSKSRPAKLRASVAPDTHSGWKNSMEGHLEVSLYDGCNKPLKTPCPISAS